jgi:hypothetical protein
MTYCPSTLEVNGVYQSLPSNTQYSGYPVPLQHAKWTLAPLPGDAQALINAGCPALTSTLANLNTNGVCTLQDSAFGALLKTKPSVSSAEVYLRENCMVVVGGEEGGSCLFSPPGVSCTMFTAAGSQGIQCRSMMNILDASSSGQGLADDMRTEICDAGNPDTWKLLRASPDCSCLGAEKSIYKPRPIDADYTQYVKKMHDIGFEIPKQPTQCWWPACTSDRRFAGVLQNSTTALAAVGCAGAVASCIDAIGSVDVSDSSQLNIVINQVCNGVLTQTSNISGASSWSGAGTSSEGDSGIPGTPQEVMDATAPLGAFAKTPNGVPPVQQRVWFVPVFWAAVVIGVFAIIGIIVCIVGNSKYYKLGVAAGVVNRKVALATENSLALDLGAADS